MGHRKSRDDEGESEFRIALMAKIVSPKLLLIGVLTAEVLVCQRYSRKFVPFAW